MSWSFSIPRPNTIRQLLSSENVTVRAVLNDGSLIQALRDEDSKIISYISNQDHLEELMKWCFTGEYADDPNYPKYSSKAIDVFTTNCGGLQLHLIDDPIFLEYISKFLDSDNSKDTTLCGHFQRIIEHYAKFCRSTIVEKFPDILERLVGNMNKLSLQYLLIQLLTEFSELFEDFNGFFTKMIEVISNGGELAYTGIPVLKELFNIDKIGLNQYQEQIERLFGAVIKFATDEGTLPLWSTESFYLLALMRDKLFYPAFQITMEEYKAKIDFETPGIISTAALRLYKDVALQSINRFFNEQTNTFLSLAVFNTIKTLPRPNLKSFLQTSDFANKLIEAFPTSYCGEITDLALFLSDIPDIPELNTQSWLDFKEGQLKERVELRKQYGGERPSFNDTNNSDSWDGVPGAFGNSSFNFDSSSDDEEDQEYGGSDMNYDNYHSSYSNDYRYQDDEYEYEYEEESNGGYEEEDEERVSSFNIPHTTLQEIRRFPSYHEDEEVGQEEHDDEQEEVNFPEEEEQQPNKDNNPLVEDDLDNDL